jgi:pyruvate/2-oxoglutarate dehydrogenase complex dihydrolipoamide dehydrogenase (E3) component
MSSPETAADAERDPDAALLDHVRPSDWVNPAPRVCYGLVVIGAGTAGLVAAAGAAGLGARVALLERHRLGGDCLNTGCVPSKALLASARAAAEPRRWNRLGLVGGEPPLVDFSIVMNRMRQARARLSPHDSAARFRELGVDVYFGQARFTSEREVDVEGTRLRFAKAVIATGARPRVPPIPGLAEAAPLTSESIFDLTMLPGSLAIVGGGPLGCELGQAFARFGSKVTILETNPRILTRDDADAAALVAVSLGRDGVEVLYGTRLQSVRVAEGKRHLQLETPAGPRALKVDAILVAAGRTRNLEGLNLAAAGVADDESGLTLDDRLRTTNRRIYAAGDVATRFRFTHMADAMARIVLQNALFPGRARVSALTIPWCTYTDPELAQVGLHANEARDRGFHPNTITVPFEGVDRAVVEGDVEGFARVVLDRRTDRILGATLAGPYAGELISVFSLAMTARLGLKAIARTIFPYPTRSEVLRKLADAYNRSRLTPGVKHWLERWLRWTNA